MRGATQGGAQLDLPAIISIHAPLAGCDLVEAPAVIRRLQFQSTHPLRGATGNPRDRGGRQAFQSTPPLRGATAHHHSTRRIAADFNPRTPCGVRPVVLGSPDQNAIFQSTHPLRGATLMMYWCCAAHPHFNPRTPCGVRPDLAHDDQRWGIISIHAPLAGCDIRELMRQEHVIISIHAPLAGCDLERRQTAC